MMKENELRLNNLVMVNYKTDLLSKVTWIQEGSINVVFDRQPDLVNGIVCSVNDLIPIPLTEEWLIKFGFRKYNLEGYSVHFRYEHPKLHSTVTAIYNSDFSIKLDNVARGIKYVHQLQNIYFALTNKELSYV